MSDEAQRDTSPELEWSADPGLAAETFARLGPWAQRILLRAWTVARWSAVHKRAAVAQLLRMPGPLRERAAEAMDLSFVPEVRGRWAAAYVTVHDLEPQRFATTFRRALHELSEPVAADADPDPPRTPPAAATRGAPNEWPAPRTKEEERRLAAITYFAGRVKPFSLEEVAELFGVSTHTVQRWRRDLGLRCFARGGVVRIAVEDVHQLITSQTA